jgi:hypothetical protein
LHVFLSYSSRDRARAEEISLALASAGNDVFFDRDDLRGGDDYNARIREQIAAADLFVFLISPESVAEGAYTLSELRMARDRWPSPGRHLLPVLLAATPMERIPAYLRSVTIFTPEGNAAAEVAAMVNARRTSRLPWIVGTGAAAAVVAVALAWLGGLLGAAETEAWKVQPNDFVTRHAYRSATIRQTEYTLDPAFPLQADWTGAVRVDRMAFGTIGDEPAMSVDVVFANRAAEPLRLDMTPRFFELRDDVGRKSEILYFCCRAAGDLLGPGEERKIQLIFSGQRGWEGKATNARGIAFHVNGLLPLVRGTWEVPALATAN